MQLRLFFILLVAGIATFSGCRKQPADLAEYHPSGNTKTDTLRLFNMLPDSTNDYIQHGYVLYVNDSMVSNIGRGLAFYGGGAYNNTPIYGVPPALPIAPGGGTYHLQLAAYVFGTDHPPLHKPDASRIVCETTVTVPAHSGYGNVFFYDSVPGKAAIRYMPVTTADPGAPAPGHFKIRVVNFSYNLEDQSGYVDNGWNTGGPTYDLQLQTADSAVVQGDALISFGSSSAYKEYSYGTFQFLVYNVTNQEYLMNSGPLNDLTGTFNLNPTLQYSTPNGNYGGPAYNYVYPNYWSFPGSNNYATLQAYNQGSYQFSAGGCYTILVIGNMYAVYMDRQYSPGTLDNFGKVQLVNAAPGQTDLQVSVEAGGQSTQITSLPFGVASAPIMVPAGTVNCTFSSHGQTLYSYSLQVPRLGNYLLAYSTDLKKVPLVFSQPITITPDDYIGGSYYPVYELNKVSCLNLTADAGNINITEISPLLGTAEIPVQIPLGGSGRVDLPYKAFETFVPEDGTLPATQYNARLSYKRNDSLANKLVAGIATPFPRLPAPGTYTLVVAGLLNATDTSEAMRMILVQHTNFIPKAQ